MSKNCSLIFIGVTDQEQQLYESALKSSRMAPHTVWISSADPLTALLNEQSWDLIICDNHAEGASEQLKSLIKSQNKDLPWILLDDAADAARVQQGLLQQASAVIPRGAPEVLLLTIRRELYHLENRKRRRQAEFHLIELEKQYRELIQSSSHALAFVNKEFKFLFANNAFLNTLGYHQLSELQGKSLLELTSKTDLDTAHKACRDYLSTPEQSHTLALQLSRTDGKNVSGEISLVRSRFERTPCTQVYFKPENQPQTLANDWSEEDLVTGLKNKLYFNNLLDQTLASTNSAEQPPQLLYIQLDDYHHLKAEAGVSGADNSIRRIADSIDRLTPAPHILAHYSADAFCILVSNEDDDAARKLAENICSSIGSGDQNHSCSAAIVPVTTDTISSQEAIRLARSILKAGEVCSYTPDPEQQPDVSISMLRQAITNDQLKLLFQPVVNLHAKAEHIYEVLFRLVDNEANELSPSLFMAMLDHAELSLEIDRWVIEESIRQLGACKGKTKNQLFININARTLADTSLLEWINSLLQQHPVSGDQLIFQISETDAAENIKLANMFVQSLEQIHAKACIKHYGSSIDSESLLRHVPTEYVKLDGSFIQELRNEEKHEAFDKLIEPLKSSKKIIVAPLVENTHPMSKLWSAGIDFVQGFYLQAPREHMDYDFFG